MEMYLGKKKALVWYIFRFRSGLLFLKIFIHCRMRITHLLVVLYFIRIIRKTSRDLAEGVCSAEK